MQLNVLAKLYWEASERGKEGEREGRAAGREAKTPRTLARTRYSGAFCLLGNQITQSHQGRGGKRTEEKRKGRRVDSRVD